MQRGEIWFAATPGAADIVKASVETARRGQTMTRQLTLNLPGGPRHFQFSMRPAVNARGQVIGMVPEGLELPAATGS